MDEKTSYVFGKGNEGWGKLWLSSPATPTTPKQSLQRTFL
jgi:hypothetical protein